ncbi:MAG TPA: PQQ-binding-like beta-propeller repeat protein [Gemmataceae bacterium]|jgi:outer membrane protein assembly factor BamB|nr:PQQ-binding-like beta-propeller repeat protein [Gemmataceae bacterium]
MRSHLFALALLFTSQALFAADWPQWRGPDRNGISKETGLLPEWPKEGPKLLWQVNDIDYGYSTPSVVGDRLYLMSNKGDSDEFVRALSVTDGKIVWSMRVGKVGPNQGMNYAAARSTPTVDGDVLYALGSNGDLACLEISAGKIKWQKNLRKDFGGQPGMWAYAESPFVDGDVLVCTPGGKDATIVCLNKKNGAVIWKCAVPDGDAAAYASIVIVEIGGQKQYVQFLSKGLVGVDAKTGRFLWRYAKTAIGSPAVIPTPVAHANLIYTGAARTGGGLVKISADNGKDRAEEVYFERGLPVAIGGAILIDGNLYGTNAEGLLCADFATGKVKWQDKSIGTGSLFCAENRLYIHGENGQVALVEVSADGYHEKGRFTPPDPPKHIRGGMEKSWVYPVVANGRLYVRDAGTLWCYDVKKAGR